MGSYVYRVKPQGVQAGEVVIHPTEYAYKPHWHYEQQQAKIIAPTVRAWDNKPDAERENVLVTYGAVRHGEPVYQLPRCHGTVWDDDLGDKYKIVGHVYKVGRKWVYCPDAAWAANTAFKSIREAAAAGGNYRPSLDQREPAMVKLADQYDLHMAHKGDARRAYRYGNGH